jgi:hypothetical protein
MAIAIRYPRNRFLGLLGMEEDRIIHRMTEMTLLNGLRYPQMQAANMMLMNPRSAGTRLRMNTSELVVYAIGSKSMALEVKDGAMKAL